MIDTNNLIKGRYRDQLIAPDHHIVYDSGWRCNTIVEHCHVLLAVLVGQMQKVSDLKLYVGKGDPNWDTAGIEDVPPNKDRLNNEVEMKENFDVFFIAPDNSPIKDLSTPTNRLQIHAELGTEVALSTREFGLFARLDEKRRYMINCVHHPVIHKGSQSTLVRDLQLTF